VSDGRAFLDSDGDVFAVDQNDGRVDWQWKSGSPSLHGDDLGGNQTVAVSDGVVVTTRVTQGHERYVVGLDERSGAVRWQRKEPPQFGEGPLDSANGSIVFTTYRGTVIEVIEDRSGSVLWSGPERPSPAGSGPERLSSMSAPVPGLVVVGSSLGGVDGLDAATGRMKWHYAGTANQMSTVAGLLLMTEVRLGGGSIANTTVALDPTDGRTLWSSLPSRDDPIYAAAGPAFMRFVWGSQADTLSRINPSTGHVIWSTPTDAYSAATSGDVIADVESTGYQTGSGYVVGRDMATGAPLWRTPFANTDLINASLFSLASPSGPVFAVEYGDRLAGYDARSGAQKWDLELPSDVTVDGTTATTGGLIIQASGSRYAIQGH
jgi:outer membrane protein assembly factor BamB